jgi:hypothetical protein
MNKIITLSSILCLFFILNGCKGQEGTKKVDSSIVNNPMNADGTIDKSKLPIMKFDKTIHDFGEITEGEVVEYSFKFTNTGKGPLVISNASGSCGCTIPSFSNKPIEPGEVGYIDVKFNSENKSGQVEKSVYILANTIPSESQLFIKAKILDKK